MNDIPDYLCLAAKLCKQARRPEPQGILSLTVNGSEHSLSSNFASLGQRIPLEMSVTL